MWGKVIEISTSGNIRLNPPRQVIPVIIQITGRLGETNLYIDHVTYGTLFYQFFYLDKIREITAVVCHKTRYSGFTRDAVDTRTLFVGNGHRLFYISRFSSLHGHDGIGSMWWGRSGDVDSIYFRIVDKLLGIVIPFFDTSLFCIGFCLGTVTAHHGHDFRTLYLLKCRAAFFLCHFTATDEAPLNNLFTHIPILFLRITKIRIKSGIKTIFYSIHFL